MDKLTLSVVEVSATLGLSRTKTYDLVRSGRLPSVRIGRRILVPRQAILEFLGAPPKESFQGGANQVVSPDLRLRWERIIDGLILFLSSLRKELAD